MYFADKKSKDSRMELKHLKSIAYWHRPIGGLVEVIQKMKESGKTDPTQLDKSQMELYIGSLLGIALEESEGRDFWIAKPEEDPPDLAFMTIVSDEKERLYFHSREVEITRYLGKEKDLVETILSKDKNYPQDYVVVCFLEITGTEELKKISNNIKDRLKNIGHVFVIFHGATSSYIKNLASPLEFINKVSVVQLAPIFDTQVIDLMGSLEKRKNDNKKLIYVDGVQVNYGLRPGEKTYPKIIKQ